MPAIWDRYWGFIFRLNCAPVLLGEFGTFAENEEDLRWLQTLLSYVGTHNISFAFWCVNPNSSDTGGILEDDWVTLHQKKHRALKPYFEEGALSTSVRGASS